MSKIACNNNLVVKYLVSSNRNAVILRNFDDVDHAEIKIQLSCSGDNAKTSLFVPHLSVNCVGK